MIDSTYILDLLKVTKCAYGDSCDFCDKPEGGSWKYEVDGRVIYHVCLSCIPSVVKTLTDEPLESLPF
jgi:hypothetical protein